jgi:septum formation protein
MIESAGDMMVILASNSPRRRELLGLLGLEFKVVPADIDETPLPTETPRDYVVRLAATKAGWVSQQQAGLVLAADTTVVDGDQILGKPVDGLDAERMLCQLRGRSHQVFSGIAVMLEGQVHSDWCCTDVPMRSYLDEEIQMYIQSGDPMDKAGAYAIQHAGFHPVENLQGCFANVMGLPLCHLTRTFRKSGIDLIVDVPLTCQNHIGYSCPVFQDILDGK